MRLIYQCGLCGARNERPIDTIDNWFGVLNAAYTPGGLTRDKQTVKAHQLHPCTPTSVGVAVLIGVDETNI